MGILMLLTDFLMAVITTKIAQIRNGKVEVFFYFDLKLALKKNSVSRQFYISCGGYERQGVTIILYKMDMNFN